ncbi:MAG: NAD(P)/FAD-dependent oxidoreductase, partial [Planctomycetota bacterium]|nr:NAD(P)/FAD-dependent oxidoreductase [Planctomycetota bacterium]
MTTERETLEIDVLFVGAGPACLAGAYHLAQQIKKHDEKAADGDKLGEVSIAVIEKSDPIGAHAISGAVMDPRGLREVIPDFIERGAPVESEVGPDSLVVMFENWKFRAPITPGPLRNHGNYVVSLNKLVIWLASECEKAGVDIFCGFPGVKLLTEEGRVVGVRTGDKGIDKNGVRKSNFEPGVDIRAKVTVLGEGPLGTLTKQLIRQFELDRGRSPQVYATGIKEVWEVPEGRLAKGEVIHTMGFPLQSDTFGGGFIYMMSGGLVSIGFVIGLDYPDPFLDIHETFQRFKNHPFVRKILDGGKM